MSVVLIMIVIINKYNLISKLKISNYFSCSFCNVFFNFFEKLFCGDGGSYLISLIIGYYLIELSNLDLIISLILLHVYCGTQPTNVYFQWFEKLKKLGH